MALRTTRADLDNAVARLNNVFGRADFDLYREGGKVRLMKFRSSGVAADSVFPLSSASILEKRIDALTIGIRLGREYR